MHTATDDVDGIDAFSRQIGGRRKVRRYARARLSRMARVTCGGVSAIGSPRSRQTSAISTGMSPGGKNTGSSGSKTLRRGGLGSRPGNHFLKGEGLAQSLPCPHRLLEQPQPHHVAQVEDRPVPAPLVREAARARLSSLRTGRSSSTPTRDHVPGGDEGEVRLSAGTARPRPRRCRVSRLP